MRFGLAVAVLRGGLLPCTTLYVHYIPYPSDLPHSQ